jgi:hypothetical protein
MKLNVSKTKELRVGFSKLIPSFAPITICGQEVDVVSEAKLLGVVLSDDLKWNRHIDYICKKAAKCLYGLCFLKRNALPSHILISTYCTHTRPIVEYACQVWHYGLPQYLSDPKKGNWLKSPAKIIPAPGLVERTESIDSVRCARRALSSLPGGCYTIPNTIEFRPRGKR